MSSNQKMSKRLTRGLGALQAFIGLGAVAGGLGLILNPSGANLGMPLDMLDNSPFSSFLIPGLVLFAANGLGSLLGAVASFTQHRFTGEAAIALGIFLITWIVIQVYWIGGFHWLHVLYLVLGMVEFILGRALCLSR